MSDGRAPRDRVALAVGALALLALSARLLALGDRPFHWVEGRVGYWTLRFLETGAYEYRPAAGGPFLYVVNRWVFTAVEPTDAAARAVVAVIGGLLPLGALLFRGRLRDDETVALAALLAFDPLLLYYSRFLRGDVPAAAFGFLAVGGLVRYRDTDARPALYLAAAAFALALAASGFAVAYPFVWLAAGLLVLDEARVRRVPGAAVERLGEVRAWLESHATPLARALFVFLGVTLFFFAPRSGGAGVGLWNPATFPTVVSRAFVASAKKFVGLRVVYRLDPTAPGGHPLLPALAEFLGTLAATAWPLVVLGVVGFFLERYGRDARGLVSFGGYTAAVGLFVFPVASMSAEPWVAVHALPWLALPGAVALAWAGRGLYARASANDPARIVAMLLVVAAAVSLVGATVAGAYAAPARGSPFAQFAQPSGDLDPALSAAERAVAGNGGVDVLYVGPKLDTSREYPRPPVDPADQASWGARLPLQWYFERMGARADSVRSPTLSGQTPPPVVVTTPEYRAAVTGRLDGYRQFDMHLGLWDRTVVVFVATP